AERHEHVVEARDDRANAESQRFEAEPDEGQHSETGDDRHVDRAVAQVGADLRADRLGALYRGETRVEILLERVADLRLDFAQVADQTVARFFTVINDALRDLARPL